MPSPSDSSHSLTSRPSTRGLTHLRLHRPWLQALLTLGLAQVILGVLVVTFSMVASSVTSTENIKRSYPSWAGFSLAFSGVVGIVSWKRPFTLVISFFSLLSVLCVMLSLAGSVLSCKNAQLARDFQECSMEGKVCVCCPSFHLPRPCRDSGQELKISLSTTCADALGALKNLLFSVCGLTVCAAIVCALSAIVCCIQIFSLDLVHTLAPEHSASGTLGPLGCVSPPAPLLHTMLDLEEFVPPVPPPPYYPPEYTCSSETDAQSITYNGSMDSPVPLYPTDCPPSYEAVMGLRGDSQATLFDPQLHDSSCICDRVASIVDEAPPTLGAPTAARSCHRLEGWPPWAGPCFPEIRRRGPRGGGRGEVPPARPPARRFSDSSGSLTPPGHRPPQPAPALLLRSHSDPGITTSSETADFRDLYTKVLEEEAASLSSADTGLCSEACLFRLAPCPSPKLLRARSAEKRRPVPTWRKVPLPSGPAPAHSLGDLKGSWPGRGLVTRFLQMSRRVQESNGHSVHGHKQVQRSPWGRPGRESLHLRSCGDLSSGSSLRRFLSGRRLERANRPHSVNGGSQESGL
ncbi:protein FAM189B isoform X2 [Vombatus ursinus]|uniref:protein FAM189B isoform X2 n=1 Tax=Vombatus ursinus TaxID=29139 RepID=UPI000FFD169F|nr:protein FAM189B isoform X2 [Vombatus ursinus]